MLVAAHTLSKRHGYHPGFPSRLNYRLTTIAVRMHLSHIFTLFIAITGELNSLNPEPNPSMAFGVCCHPQSGINPGGDIIDDGLVDMAFDVIFFGCCGSYAGDKQVVQLRVQPVGDVPLVCQSGFPTFEIQGG